MKSKCCAYRSCGRTNPSSLSPSHEPGVLQKCHGGGRPNQAADLPSEEILRGHQQVNAPERSRNLSSWGIPTFRPIPSSCWSFWFAAIVSEENGVLSQPLETALLDQTQQHGGHACHAHAELSPLAALQSPAGMQLTWSSLGTASRGCSWQVLSSSDLCHLF